MTVTIETRTGQTVIGQHELVTYVASLVLADLEAFAEESYGRMDALEARQNAGDRFCQRLFPVGPAQSQSGCRC